MAGTKAVPQQAFAAAAETLTEARDDPGGASVEGGEVSFVKARIAKEVLQPQIVRVGLKMKSGLGWKSNISIGVTSTPLTGEVGENQAGSPSRDSAATRYLKSVCPDHKDRKLRGKD